MVNVDKKGDGVNGQTIEIRTGAVPKGKSASCMKSSPFILSVMLILRLVANQLYVDIETYEQIRSLHLANQNTRDLLLLGL